VSLLARRARAATDHLIGPAGTRCG
jgi:hypothetical protein